VYELILIADSAYSREQILSMEKGILNRLEWNLTVPTSYMFLVRFLKAASSGIKTDKEVKIQIVLIGLVIQRCSNIDLLVI